MAAPVGARRRNGARCTSWVVGGLSAPVASPRRPSEDAGEKSEAYDRAKLLEERAAFGHFSSYVALFRWSPRTGMIYYLPTLAATRAEAQKATYLPRKGGVTRGLGLVGASGPADTDMITLTHSQLLPASVHPVPARLSRSSCSMSTTRVVRCLTPFTLAAAHDF